jgi:hypothetical protein
VTTMTKLEFSGRRSRKCAAAACAVLWIVAACGCGNAPDTYRDRFPLVATGASRTKVVELLGPPTSHSYVELLGSRGELLEWKAHPPASRRYVCVFVAERVVMKGAIE